MENYISLMTDEIYRWFHMLNEKYYANNLPEPIITIQKTRKNIRGYFTLDKVWQVKNDNGEVDENNSRYEICMSANWLELDNDINPITELVAVLQHELCHYQNKLNNVKDCSGKMHNKKFRDMAETKDLEVEKAKGVGYGITRANDRLKDFIENEIKPDISVFKFYRVLLEGPKQETEKKKFIAYVCPVCGKEAKGEDGMSLMCAECQVNLEEKPKGKRGRKAKEDNDNENNNDNKNDNNSDNDNEDINKED